MLHCSFTLNNEPISKFEILGCKFNAYSGELDYRNKPTWMCVPGFGAIPVGRYFIVDRESGGLRSKIKDAVKSLASGSNRFDWFALYAIDSYIDDETFCAGFRRGEFRLHPSGRRGISKGCIRIEKETDFYMIRNMLLGAGVTVIPETDVNAYGIVSVKQIF